MTIEESLERIARDIRWMRDTHDLIAMWIYDYCDQPYHRRKEDPNIRQMFERLRERRKDEA